MAGTTGLWTHPSVRALSTEDPAEYIREKARSAALSAIENGWTGPPYDPGWLAHFLGNEVVARADILEARTVATQSGRPRIEYNPNRPSGRVRFSIAHEIAHTFFDDCLAKPRYRGKKNIGDDWQLEVLCNIAASELLMPDLSPEIFNDQVPAIEELQKIQKQYAVSFEVMLLHAARTTLEPCVIFLAVPSSGSGNDVQYSVAYLQPSRTAPLPKHAEVKIPAHSVIKNCTAIGFTDHAIERWEGMEGRIQVECIGLPPLPGHVLPRVAGIIRTERRTVSPQNVAALHICYGDATKPRGAGPKIIAHIVNDKTPNWGAGFGIAIKKAFPQTQQAFRAWALSGASRLCLGNTFSSVISDDLFAYEMICQKGYGPSTEPRIRYLSLRVCLNSLRSFAQEKGASVHMPRLGSGNAGGHWPIIREIIDEQLVRHGIPVTIYDLPLY